MEEIGDNVRTERQTEGRTDRLLKYKFLSKIRKNIYLYNISLIFQKNPTNLITSANILQVQSVLSPGLAHSLESKE